MFNGPLLHAPSIGWCLQVMFSDRTGSAGANAKNSPKKRAIMEAAVRHLCFTDDSSTDLMDAVTENADYRSDS